MSADDVDTDRDLRVSFGHLERHGAWLVPEELSISVHMGNAELDLRDAILARGTTTFRVSVVMGNLELVVPPGMHVEVAVNPTLSNVEYHPRRGTAAPRSTGRSQPPSDGQGTPYREALFPDDSEDADGIDLRPDAPHIRVIGSVRLGNIEVHTRRRGESESEEHKRLRAERRERWHARHEKRRRRWRELHAEKQMWLRGQRDGANWLPWWLRARMRRRIFSWLALAVIVGFGIGWYVDGRPAWWVFVLGFLGIGAVSGAIAFQLTHPLIMAVRAARDIGDGKLDTRIDVDRHSGETRMLAVALNEMASKIQQQLADQRQLLAAVSHELRTPLGHMRVLVETARDATQRVTAETALPQLDEIEREILHLDDLVGKLLASSRLEFGNLDRRTLDLGSLVTDAATSAGIAPEVIEATGDVEAAIDPTLVRRAVANLLDNARVHGGGAVAVRIERRAGQVAIEVDDAGPGVTSDRRDDAFRAFVPSSGGGLGLGLALVSRIAVAHGGGAWIHDRPGGGARVGFAVSATATAPGRAAAASAARPD